jgi:hypothetical protein
MKRSLEQDDGEAIERAINIIDLPADLFVYVASFLDFADLYNLYQACVCYRRVETGPEALRYVPCLGPKGAPLPTSLDALPLWTRNCCTAEVARRVKRVAETKLLVGKYEKVLYELRDRLSDPCLYTRILRGTSGCSCCHAQFGVTIYWPDTAEPVPLCDECELRFEKTASCYGYELKKSRGGWQWVTATDLKSLCGVAPSVRADTFAAEHGIRSRANTRVPNKLAAYMSGRKDFYFYHDIQVYLKCDARSQLKTCGIDVSGFVNQARHT